MYLLLAPLPARFMVSQLSLYRESSALHKYMKQEYMCPIIFHYAPATGRSNSFLRDNNIYLTVYGIVGIHIISSLLKFSQNWDEMRTK